MSHNGSMHVSTAPYHPSSNDLAENAVQTFKKGLKHAPQSPVQKLLKFLFTSPQHHNRCFTSDITHEVTSEVLSRRRQDGLVELTTL